MSNSTRINNEDSNKEEQLITLAKSKPGGISNEDIKQMMPNLSLEELAIIINKCLKNG